MKINKQTFNLKQNLWQQAMGAQWQPYRGPLEWFNLEDIISGNEEWKKWVEINPSLSNAVTKIRHFRDKKMGVFINRYGLSAQEVDNTFYTLVGYAPEYGCYMLSIGPYVGNKEADQLNNFGYFVWKMPSGTEKEIKSSLDLKMKKYWSEWSEILTPDDFQIIVDAELDEKQQEGGKNWKHKKTVFPSLDPESTSGQQLFSQRPILNPGLTEIKPNAKGLRKMMLHSASEGNWGDLLNNAIQKLADQKGASPEELEAWMNDFDFLQSVYKEVAALQQQLVDVGAVPEGMLAVPNFLGTSKNRGVGSAQPSALKTSTTQRNNLQLKEEIIQTIVSLGSEDAEAVAGAMSARRSGRRGVKAKGVIDPEKVSNWISEIQSERVQTDKNGNTIGEKSYEELLAGVQIDVEECLQGGGYSNLDSAVRMACLYYADVGISDVDPATRAKLSISMSNPPALQGVPEEIPNITSEDLAEWRLDKTQKDEQLALDEAAAAEALGGEQEEFEIDEVPEVPQETTQPTQPIQPVTPVVDEEEEQVPFKKYKPDLSNLMAKTIVRLVRLAEDLDNEGKSQASEEIHKVIRKYHKRLK